jgi:hypothetical protein
METLLIIAVVVVVAALIYFNRSAKSLDINADGKVNAEDAKVAVENAVEGVKQTADVNKDGKVDVADVKVAVAKTKAAVKAKTNRKPRTPKKTA